MVNQKMDAVSAVAPAPKPTTLPRAATAATTSPRPATAPTTPPQPATALPASTGLLMSRFRSTVQKPYRPFTTTRAPYPEPVASIRSNPLPSSAQLDTQAAYVATSAFSSVAKRLPSSLGPVSAAADDGLQMSRRIGQSGQSTVTSSQSSENVTKPLEYLQRTQTLLQPKTLFMDNTGGVKAIQNVLELPLPFIDDVVPCILEIFNYLDVETAAEANKLHILYCIYPVVRTPGVYGEVGPAENGMILIINNNQEDDNPYSIMFPKEEPAVQAIKENIQLYNAARKKDFDAFEYFFRTAVREKFGRQQ
jgi:hypothetical protein